MNKFPLAYRWFLAKGLTNWQPWYFIDTDLSIKENPDYSKNEFASRAFKIETAADFDVYLFARRQDRDDFAFFVVKDGKLVDKVISIHLSFAKKIDLKTPLCYSEINENFVQWLGITVIRDVEDWLSEEDMYDK